MDDELIEIKNISVGKISGKIIVAALDLHVAKQKAIQECRKYLPEKRNHYLEAKGNGVLHNCFRFGRCRRNGNSTA